MLCVSSWFSGQGSTEALMPRGHGKRRRKEVDETSVEAGH